MDTLDAARYMKGLVERTSRDSSRRTNWAKTFAVIALTAFATAAVGYLGLRLAGLFSRGRMSGLLGTAALVAGFPGLFRTPPGRAAFIGMVKAAVPAFKRWGEFR